MDSRPILKNTKKIGVYIDSKTFNELLDKKSRVAFAILRHHDSDYLEFIRSPLKTKHKELSDIVEYDLVLDNDSKIDSINIVRKQSKTEMNFGYKMADIQLVAEKICRKKKVSKDELNTVTTAFIQAVFNRFEKSNIYITNNKILLKNRLWFESHFPGYPLNVMSVDEASIFLDLFFKKNEKFFASNRYELNKGFWYWLSMRLKIPHYNVGDKMIDALGFRLYYILMALDEMGIQYFLGVNNDTMDNTLYHFNYLISLITGIFDNLALKTDTHLGINFSNPIRVSLSNKNGKDFLKEVRKKNPQIRAHINSYVNFIKLIYSFRELVIHREGLSKTGFGFNDESGSWKANFIKISKEIKEYIKNCGDLDSDYDPLSKWGVYQIHDDLFLDPYNFSTQAINMLVEFVDKYLELLDYPSFIEKQKQNSDYLKSSMSFFEKYHLGF